MMHSKPMRKFGITSRTVGHETILSSDTEKAIHILNPTAKLVWDLCDGQHSLEEIEMKMRSSFAVPAEYPVSEDIRKILLVLDQKGLLESQAGRR
jgi:hypothetical protein